MRYFSSDWHLGHTNVIRYAGRPFSSIEENDSRVMENIAKLSPGDTLYFLGDLSMKYSVAERFFKSLRPDIDFYWVLGNHDMKVYSHFADRCKGISNRMDITIHGTPTTLSHFPMVSWPRSHYGAYHLFGHHHTLADGTYAGIPLTGKMLNVNFELHNYDLWNEFEVLKAMEGLPENWNEVHK